MCVISHQAALIAVGCFSFVLKIASPQLILSQVANLLDYDHFKENLQGTLFGKFA